jgi:hypothetical protein
LVNPAGYPLIGMRRSRAERFGQSLTDMRAIPLWRDVIGRRMPLAEKVGVRHLQFDSATLGNSLSNCPGAPCSKALFFLFS